MAMDHDLWQTQSRAGERRRLVLAGTRWRRQRPILNVLRWLDFKLDLLLYHLRSRELSAVFPRFAQSLDLSGSGVSLREAPDLHQGDRILLSLTLPDAPSRPIFAVGEVVRVEPPAGAGERRVAVRFLEMAEEARERIIRFTFRQQRRELAQRGSEGVA